MSRHRYLELVGSGPDPSLPRFTALLLDRSGSMGQGDYPPTRLGAGIAALNQLLNVKRERHPDDVVAVVAFGDDAVVCHPGAAVGRSYEELASCLKGLEPDGNTAIGSGLQAARRLCLRHLQQYSGRRWALQVILATDGENTCGTDPAAVAQELKEDGVWIDTIGIGTPAEIDATTLRSVASLRPDGTPSYCFIGDTAELVRHTGLLAHHYLVPLS